MVLLYFKNHESNKLEKNAIIASGKAFLKHKNFHSHPIGD